MFLVSGGHGAVEGAPIPGTEVRERLTHLAVAHRKGHRPHPVVEGLAQPVHAEFLDAEQNQGVVARGDVAPPNGPPRQASLAGVAATGQRAKGAPHQRMREVQEQRVRAGSEDLEVPQRLHERLRPEGDPADGPRARPRCSWHSRRADAPTCRSRASSRADRAGAAGTAPVRRSARSAVAAPTSPLPLRGSRPSRGRRGRSLRRAPAPSA